VPTDETEQEKKSVSIFFLVVWKYGMKENGGSDRADGDGR
jgi:hypothetical protein